MAEAHDETQADVLGVLLAEMQKAKPGARILILDLPGDVSLRAVTCKPSPDKPAPFVQLTITVESADFVALQEIAKRLLVTSQAGEAIVEARREAAEAKG